MSHELVGADLLFSGMDGPELKPGDYMEESKNGDVVLYRKDGSPFAFLSKDTYAKLRSRSPRAL